MRLPDNRLTKIIVKYASSFIRGGEWIGHFKKRRSIGQSY